MVLMGVVFVVPAAIEGEMLAGLLFAVVFCGGPAAAAVVWVHRSRVVCSAEGLEVVGLWSRRWIEWSRVCSASPGYWGVEVSLSDGSTVVAGAVQKANVSVWLGRRTRADEVADFINARVSGARRTSPG